MKKFLCLALCFVLCFALVSCSSSELEGKWELESGSDAIEFKEDGACRFYESEDNYFDGTYEDDGKELTVTIQGETLISGTYEIDGDTLTIHASSGDSVLKRVD